MERKNGTHFELHFPATRETVQGVLAMAQEWALDNGVGRADMGTLRLVLEELLLNICFYAYPGSDPEAEAGAGPGGEAELLLWLGPASGIERGGMLPADPPGPCQATPGRAFAGLAAAPGPNPQEEQRIFLRIRDAGRPFDPLAHTPAPVGLCPGATPAGDRGLAFVRLLAVDVAYSRTDGLNVLRLAIPLGGAQGTEAAEAGPAPAAPEASAAARGFFHGPGGLPHFWRTRLAVKQTFFLGLSTAFILWAALFFFHRTVNSEREKAARSLGGQIMRTLDLTASDLLDRLAAGTKALAGELGYPDNKGVGSVPDGPPLRTATQRELARSLLAEKTVFGLVYTSDSRFQEWLLTLRDGALSQRPLSFTFMPAWSVNRRAGALPVWQGPLTDMPGSRDRAETALFLVLPWQSVEKKTVGLASGGPPGNPEGATGTIGVLVSMREVAELLRAASGASQGRPFLLNRDGEYLIPPRNRTPDSGQATIFADARACGSAFLKELGRAMLRGEEGGMRLPGGAERGNIPWLPEHEPVTAFYRPIQGKGQSPAFFLGLLLPSGALGAMPGPLPPEAALFVSLGPLAFGLLVWRVTSRTLRPLRDLSASLENMADGDLATPLPLPLQADETGSMLHSFERVRLTMRAALRNLTARAAAQERLVNELAVARAIQENLLTTEFPVADGVDFCARIDMAREVCGDLYDCFCADTGTEGALPHRLCCVVGDVSGKGVPAAMMTSGALSLARAALLEGLSPAAVLGRVNEALVRTASAGMFVTMLAGVLDPRTGCFAWASAGHPPPMRAMPASPDRKARVIPGDWPGELALGIKKGVAYTNFSFWLESDEAVLLYTDGAFEALAPAGRGSRGRFASPACYGEDRLALSLVRHMGKDGARGLLEGIRADIFAHMAGSEPHDDITLMVIRH